MPPYGANTYSASSGACLAHDRHVNTGEKGVGTTAPTNRAHSGVNKTCVSSHMAITYSACSRARSARCQIIAEEKILKMTSKKNSCYTL